MPLTPDQFPGTRYEETIVFESGSQFPFNSGEVSYVTGTISGSGFFFNEQNVIVGPLNRFLDSGSHAALRQLIHFIDEGPAERFETGAFKEKTYPLLSSWPSSVTWYVNSTKTQKIVEVLYNRNVIQQSTSSVWKIYGQDGLTVSATVTDAITYSGVNEISRTRTIT